MEHWCPEVVYGGTCLTKLLIQCPVYLMGHFSLYVSPLSNRQVLCNTFTMAFVIIVGSEGQDLAVLNELIKMGWGTI